MARDLAALGHDAIHVRDIGLAQGQDPLILERAASEQRIVITQDTDYGTLLVTGARRTPSVILFRMRDGSPSTQTNMLRRYLTDLESSLNEGAIVVIEDATIRVRMLK